MIEFKIQSVVLQDGEVQEQFPDLYSVINSYLPKRKSPKRRRRKKKETVDSLINEIIDSIEK